MNEKLALHNEIYNIAKQISSLVDNDKKFDLLNNLGEIVSQCFQADKHQAIEDAIAVAIENKELDVVNIIMDEAQGEIESALYETEGGQEYESTMLLMPCVMVTKQKYARIPSINDFEEVIREHLVQAGVIKNPLSFRLGTVRMSQESMDEMNLHTWWKVHRQIIEEDLEEASVARVRSRVASVKVDSPMSLFYFVPLAVAQASDDEMPNPDIQNILNSDIIQEVWDKVSEEMSSDTINFSVMPPQSLYDAIGNAEHILQSVQFDSFFNEYAYEDNVEVAYIQHAEEPNDYVVLFFDGEEQRLLNYYVYETNGEVNEFLQDLVDKCIQEPQRTLYGFDQAVTNEVLQYWHDSEEGCDISSLMNSAQPIDLQATYNFFMGCAINLDNPTMH